MNIKKSLFPRALISALHEALNDTPVVCLLGPRQCGKTTLAQMLAPDRTFISLDEDRYYQIALSDPDGFISSLPDMVVIDEVQRVPALLPAIKLSVDQDRRPGRFLLTGSANLLLLPKVMESLAGRMEVVQLQPLSEAEKERQAGHKDKSEVDLVMTRGSLTWGIEVKSTASINMKDARGLLKLSQQCGSDFQGGIVFYNGSDTLPIANTPFFAVPLSQLWNI